MSIVVDTARTYLRVPYVPCGRNRFGVDCIGLVICVARDLGWKGDDHPGVPFTDQFEQVMAIVEGRYKWERAEEPMPGDLVIFRSRAVTEGRTEAGMLYNHAGIDAGETFIHASNDNWAYRVIEEPWSVKSTRRLAARFRFPEKF